MIASLLTVSIIGMALVIAIGTIDLVFRFKYINATEEGPIEALLRHLPRLTIDQLEKKFPDIYDEREDLRTAAKHGVVWVGFAGVFCWAVIAFLLDTIRLQGIELASWLFLLGLSALSVIILVFMVAMMVNSMVKYRRLSRQLRRSIGGARVMAST